LLKQRRFENFLPKPSLRWYHPRGALFSVNHDVTRQLVRMIWSGSLVREGWGCGWLCASFDLPLLWLFYHPYSLFLGIHVGGDSCYWASSRWSSWRRKPAARNPMERPPWCYYYYGG